MEINSLTNPSAINNLPKDWQIQSIDSVCLAVTSGGTPLRSNLKYYENGSIPWIKTKELKDWYIDDSEEMITPLALKETSAKIFPTNTVLMAMYGDGRTITSLGILSKPAATNQACCAMIVNPKVCDHLYLFYALKLHRHDFLHIATGGAQRNLSGTLIRNFGIRIPPLPEQRAIAQVLGALDDKIELNRRMNRTLESIARAMFREWFVEKEDVAGWEIGTISNYAQVASGKRPENRQEEADAEYKYPLFGGAGIMAYTNKLLYDFPILLTGRVGTLGLVFRITDPCWASDNTLVIMSSKPEYYFYLYFFLKQADLKMLNRGSTQPLLTQSDLQKIEMPLPPENRLIGFTSMVSPMFAKINANEKESHTLAGLRDALLPKLMRGEVRVKA